nr:hypothetical protein [Pandoravirus massiliensis]
MDQTDSESAPDTARVESAATDAGDMPAEQQQRQDRQQQSDTPLVSSDETQLAAPAAPAAPPPRVVVVRDARYCRVTGCVLVPMVVDGVRIMANWVMSSADNIIAPRASARMDAAIAQTPGSTLPQRPCELSKGGVACVPDGSVTRAAGESHVAAAETAAAAPTRYTLVADRLDARRAWPTICRALGTVYRPRAVDIGNVRIHPRDDDTGDTGMHFLRARAVSMSSLPCVQLAHRAAQAHSSIVSVARPALSSREPPSVLGRLIADGAVGRPSVLWDMRARARAVTVAVGVAAPVADPNTALVRLYRPDHPDVIAAGESIMALARTGALVRVLGIEVAVSRVAPTMRLPLDTPEWAVVDVGVRACYFDQETRRAVVDALGRAGPASWRASPLWARGTVMAHEAEGVLGLACQEAPVLALVLSGHDPARPVRIRMDRSAYVHETPLHEVRYRWPDPDDRPADHEDDDSGDIAVRLQYAQVDLASWMNRSPGGTCLIGNCAFQGRAVLIDYEADVMAVFSDGAP